MIVRPIKTRIFREGERLTPFITSYLPKVRNGSIIVITSKIVALSERRTLPKATEAAKLKAMRRESDFVMRTDWTWLTVKDHTVLSSAGIDESNANGKLILLPKDSFKTAALLRNRLRKYYRIKRLGILITDSRLLPLKAGIIGVAIGYAGFSGVRDDRGKKDLFGRTLKFPRVDVADSLAAAAVLHMGEAAESQPLAIITRARAAFVERVDRRELMMDFREDAYAPIFRATRHLKLKRLQGPW